VTPGPCGVELLRTLRDYMRDPFSTLVELARQYGDVVRFIDGPVKAFLVNGAENIERVLVKDAPRFVPVRPYSVERAMRHGLFTSHGYLHRHQREMLEGAYAAELTTRFADSVAGWGAWLRDQWRDGAEINLEAHLERAVVYTSAEIVFGESAKLDWEELVEPAVPVNEYLGTRSTNPLTAVREALRLGRDDRVFWSALRRLEHGIDREIRRRRRADTSGRNDFLSVILEARDKDGDRMTDQQARDEAIANYTTGNSVTVSGLLFTWYLLGRHADVEAELGRELDSVLAGRLPTAADLPSLRYTRMVIAESMRLYPPAWTIGRRLVTDYELGGAHMPSGSLVLVSPYVVQRDERYFSEPEHFDPERWTPQALGGRPSYAYIPFSAGPRSCLGEHLAWLEMVLLLAAVAQRWRLRVQPGYPVELLPLISLRPRYGMRMRVEARTAAP
jgi:cytochrome P450